MQDALVRELENAKDIARKGYNKSRGRELILKKGDKVYLLRRNIKTKRPTSKLDHIKIGPFSIKKKISDVNYELELPHRMRIHPIFHISLLEPAPPNAKPTTEDIETESENEYEVERIIDYDGHQYYVKWKDFPESENTWEKPQQLTHCQGLVRRFHRRQDQTKKRGLAATTLRQQDLRLRQTTPQLVVQA